MERYTMFLDWKNQHCENDSNSQSNLQIQCNPNQITNDIFHRTRTKDFKICMETQKTPNSQRNPEMIQRNGKISHALGLKKLILLKWLYYPKQSTDLMQYLSKYP